MKKISSKRFRYGLNSLSILLVGLGLILLSVPLIENLDEVRDGSLIIIASILLIVGSALAGYSFLFDKKDNK